MKKIWVSAKYILTKFNENLSKMDIMPKYFVKLNLYVKELRKLKWSVILSRKNIFSKKIYQVSYLKPKRNENCETIQNISLRIWDSKMKKSPCDEHYCKNLKNLAGINFFCKILLKLMIKSALCETKILTIKDGF